MPDAAPLKPGDPAALGRYQVVGRLGVGGQGAVFLGRSPSGDPVAIKLLHERMSSDSSARTRFAREVEAAQKVSPFCTARVLDHDLDGRPPYIISEFIDGPPLYDVVLQEGPFGGGALERLAIGTATALAAIHEAGIVHRDFKPNNVLLAADGPRVVDFGIARSVNSDQSSVTATGMVVGTPGYLAPEQLTGEPLTPAVDMFAWGATMVFAATGRSPFEADTLPVIINRILNEEPDLTRLTGVMREMVAAALTKDPRRRPAAHQILLRLLGQVGAAPGPAADRDALLGKGTQVAAQMPAPPPIVTTPPPRPVTPAPTMYQGPATPNPPMMGQGPATPNPPMMHQGPATPNPPAMMPGPGTPPWQQGRPGPPPPYSPAPYAPPPPRRRSGNAPIFIGIGCAVALLLVVGVPIAIAVGVLHRAQGDYRLGVPDAYAGTWKGTGRAVASGGGPVSVTITLKARSVSGSAVYGDCTGSLVESISNSSNDKMVFTQFLYGAARCPTSSYIALSRDGSSMDWAMSDTPNGAAVATGTLAKQE